MTLRERIAAEIDKAIASGKVHPTCGTAAIDGVVYERGGNVVGYTPKGDPQYTVEPAGMTQAEADKAHMMVFSGNDFYHVQGLRDVEQRVEALLPPLPPLAQPAPDSAFIKHDLGKPRYALLPMDAIEDIVKVLNHGAKKYDDHNWSKCPNLTRYYDATMRHLAAWLRKEDIDPESGLPHLAHAGCSLLFLAALAQRGKTKDDRP